MGMVGGVHQLVSTAIRFGRTVATADTSTPESKRCQQRPNPAREAHVPPLQGRRYQGEAVATNRSSRPSYSHKCPTYIQSTPPCQGSCPAGEDIRGYLDIVRGIEKPPAPTASHAVAGIRLAPPDRGQPVPVGDGPRLPGAVRDRLQPQRGRRPRRHQLGRALPRRIRHREQAQVRQAARRRPARRSPLSAAARPACPAPTNWRCKGHAVTVFDEHEFLGGMMRYGIPGFRTPRDVLDAEIQRILDLGVKTRLKMPRSAPTSRWSRSARTSTRCSSAWARKSGRPLPIAERRSAQRRHRHRLPQGLQRRPSAACRQARGRGRRRRHLDRRGDRRAPSRPHRACQADRLPERAIAGHMAHDVAVVSAKQGAEVTLTSVFDDRQDAGQQARNRAGAGRRHRHPRRLAPVARGQGRQWPCHRAARRQVRSQVRRRQARDQDASKAPKTTSTPT